MKSIRWIRRSAVFVITSVFASMLSAQTRTIEVDAGKDNRFRMADGGSVLKLKQGEKVHFRIASSFGGEKARDGSVHSFVVKALRDEGWDVRLPAGVKEFDLVAPAPGEYLIECTVKCGPGHDTMNMKMVVE